MRTDNLRNSPESGVCPVTQISLHQNWGAFLAYEKNSKVWHMSCGATYTARPLWWYIFIYFLTLFEFCSTLQEYFLIVCGINLFSCFFFFLGDNELPVENHCNGTHLHVRVFQYVNNGVPKELTGRRYSWKLPDSKAFLLFSTRKIDLQLRFPSWLFFLLKLWTKISPNLIPEKKIELLAEQRKTHCTQVHYFTWKIKTF